MITLEQYREIVGKKVIHDIYKKVREFYGKHIVHVNSTYQGGGVAEMLGSLVPLMNDVGIKTGWRILHGYPDFYTITKKFHNALQGEDINFTEMKQSLYVDVNKDFSSFTHIDHDCLIIHDPQPLPLIKFYDKTQPWIWRCHVDLSHPNPEVWEFLSSFLLKYDLVIVSNEDYKKADLPLDQRVIHPAIDPLSAKNKELSDDDVHKYLEKFGVPLDKPLITQISRFDKWKDPLGVLEIFKLVKKQIDCRLVLCGNMATDDPEGIDIFKEVNQKAEHFIQTGDVILITAENNILVNALQKFSDVIIQKSIREGFGLTISESLWKETPVVASKVGGIPLQIEEGKSGFLLQPENITGFADRIRFLLKDPDRAQQMGQNGKEYVRKNFLITRLLMDYLNILSELIGQKT